MDKYILKDTAFESKDDYSHYMNQINNQVFINEACQEEHYDNYVSLKRSLYEKYLDSKYSKSNKNKEEKQLHRHNSYNSIDKQKSKSPNDFLIKNSPSKKLIKHEKEKEISVIDKNINSLNNSFISSLKLIETKEKKESLIDQKVNINKINDSVIKANNKLYYEEVNKFLKDRQNNKIGNIYNHENEALDLNERNNITDSCLFKRTFDKFSSKITSEDPILKQNIIKKYNDLNANSNYYFPSEIYNTNSNTNTGLYNDLQFKERTNKNKLYNVSCTTKR